MVHLNTTWANLRQCTMVQGLEVLHSVPVRAEILMIGGVVTVEVAAEVVHPDGETRGVLPE